jgi:hypothetical protein
MTDIDVAVIRDGKNLKGGVLGFVLGNHRQAGIVMNFVVLPQTAFVKSPLSLPLLLYGVLGHALFVGLPIALAARRITNQSSFSTQAA